MTSKSSDRSAATVGIESRDRNINKYSSMSKKALIAALS
jgi:hypothetical protein